MEAHAKIHAKLYKGEHLSVSNSIPCAESSVCRPIATIEAEEALLSLPQMPPHFWNVPPRFPCPIFFFIFSKNIYLDFPLCIKTCTNTCESSDYVVSTWYTYNTHKNCVKIRPSLFVFLSSLWTPCTNPISSQDLHYCTPSY